MYIPSTKTSYYGNHQQLLKDFLELFVRLEQLAPKQAPQDMYNYFGAYAGTLDRIASMLATLDGASGSSPTYTPYLGNNTDFIALSSRVQSLEIAVGAVRTHQTIILERFAKWEAFLRWIDTADKEP